MKRRSTTPSRAAIYLAALSVMFLVAAAPGPAAAYVLEGPFILDLTAGAMGQLFTLEVTQKILIVPLTPQKLPSVFDETAIYRMPDGFRSDIVSDRVRRTHVEVGERSLTVVDGRVSASPDPFDRYQRLLRCRTRQQLMQTLAAMGVDTAISSLGRAEGRVVFVVGASYPDDTTAQLAIDKTTFLPVRLLLTDGGRHLAIIYDNWQKLQGGWFPYQVDFVEGDQLVRQIRVIDVRLNPSIPASQLDIDALAATYASDSGLPDGSAREAVEAVQQAVEDFQKKFE
jgi:hypothetical protein